MGQAHERPPSVTLSFTALRGSEDAVSGQHIHPHRSLGASAWAFLYPLATLLVAVSLLSACSRSAHVADPAAVQPPQPPLTSAPPVRLGVAQHIAVASSFGPGSADVPATITVYAVRDHVAPDPKIRPITPATHWASADVQVCRTKPVILGYPAWVLGDDSGRTAQQTRVLHAQFPQPTFPNSSLRAGCARGWVTWVTADILKPTKVTFEQARTVSVPWRIR